MPTAWSWKRALVHALLAFVVTVALGAGAFAVLGGGPNFDAHKFGEGVGRLSAFTACAFFVASRLGQTGRRKAALGLVTAYVVLVGGTFAAIMLIDPHHARSSHPLTEADRAPLVVVDDGERRLRHPTLGFSIRHPGPDFHESPQVGQVMGKAGPDPETQTYGFMDEGKQAVLVVSVMMGMGGSQGNLSAHLDGVQKGIAHSVPGGDVRWLSKDVRWDDQRRVARLSALAGAAHIDLAAYAAQTADGTPYLVNITLTGRDATPFAAVLDSFRL